jgi:twitching motility protein PilT
MDPQNPNLLSDSELDALVRELNESARRDRDAGPELSADDLADEAEDAGIPPINRAWSALPRAEIKESQRLHLLLAAARERQASDLLLVAGNPATVRIDGRLVALDGGNPLENRDTVALCAALIPAERRRALARAGASDFSFSREGLGRFRCNVHRQRGGWAAAIRLLPAEPPGFEELNLPQVLESFADREHGLVIVTGPTGCGKSTTQAALLRRIIARRRVHVITIEDPVEYEHRGRGSIVEHIEIGRDAPSFSSALRSALRQDPDVIFVGEMRDRESISMAVTAAETGHLVLSTLHTGDAPQTVSRILDSYPAEQLDAVRTQLAASLTAIVSQTLLPRADGIGRVPAVEVLLASDAVRALIRNGKIERLRSQMSLEFRSGMMTLNRSLAELVGRGLVDETAARLRARDEKEFEAFLSNPSDPSAS